MDTYTDIYRDGDLQPGWERVAMEGVSDVGEGGPEEGVGY